MPTPHHVWCFALAALCCAPLAHGETLVLPAARDATLFESEFGDTASGAGNYLFAGMTAQNLARRALIQFDLSALPDGATILDARLRLHMSRTATSGVLVDLHRVTRGWSEGLSAPFGEEGAGVPAEPGDVTWLHTRFDWETPEYWDRPGGDFIDDSSATTVVYGNGYYDWHDAPMIDDLRGWVQDPETNAGWILLGEETTPQTAKRFGSRTHPDETVRPQLIVDFVRIPEPGNLLLFVVCALPVARIRR